MKTKSLPPYAPTLIESTRAIGYSLEAAVADIIDNPKTFIVGSSSYHILDNYVIGNQKDVKSIAFLGGIISVLTSKWVYLFLIILPILI